MKHKHSTQGLRELALIFLRLGTTAFGGPAAHIAMMEAEFVRKRRWLSEERFVDLLGAVNLIPGPNSTELAIYIGFERAGAVGLLLGGLCFILPAALIVTAISWAYARYGMLPEAQGVLYGVKPVILAVIAQALASLGRKTLRRPLPFFLGLAAAGASLTGLAPLPILAGAGLVAAARGPWRALAVLFLAPSRAALAAAAAAAPPLPFSLSKLFLFFLKLGSVLYGSGYVLLAFLRQDLVTHYGWLTDAQLLDATAVGQFTPGPVFTTATFIGFLLAGARGALVATLGIFLPSLFFVAVAGALIPRLRRSAFATRFLEGVNSAALGLLAAVMIQLALEALVDTPTMLWAAASLFILLRFGLNSAWLVLTGAAAGLLK